MKKLCALVLLVGCASASAMTYFLVAQWLENGKRYCRYSDGTVLNVGVKLCPLQIEN